jgi:hypothetical protein
MRLATDRRMASLPCPRGATVKTAAVPPTNHFSIRVPLSLRRYDESNNRAKAIILWDSKEAAESAEETLLERRAKMTAQVGISASLRSCTRRRWSSSRAHASERSMFGIVHRFPAGRPQEATFELHREQQA